MQFSKIALAAVAAVAFAGQAQAATAYITGASATSINYVKALKGLCGGTFTVYKEATGTTSLGNFYTAKCSQNFTGVAGIDVVAFNVAGGSYTAVLNSTLGTTGVKFVTALSGTPVAGTGALAGINLVSGITAAGSIKSEGGFLDIEPAAFDSTLLDPFGGVEGLADKIAPAAFSQAFGVAVSRDLYAALQTAQGLAGCTADTLTPACQPTVSRAQYASIASVSTNSAKTDINSLFGVPAGKLTLCRRASTSGTQAASNQFFLNNLTGNGPNAGLEAPADAATYGPGVLATFEVKEGAGTSNARDCLNATGYGIGVLSLENVPAASTGYRFVKLNRVEGFDAAKASQATGISGEYEFAYQSVKFTATGAGNSAVIDAIDAQLTNLGGTNGLWGSGESQFGRNGNNANVITKQ